MTARLATETLGPADHSSILLDAIPTGVLVQDADGRIVTVNGAAERILGWRREQLLGLTPPNVGWRAVRDDGSDLCAETYPSMVALATGSVVAGTQIGVFNPLLERMQWIRVTAIPIRAEHGHPSGVYTIFENVSDMKRLEAELGQSQKMEALGRLAGGIAHDFNNLLTVLMAYATVVEEQLEGHPALQHVIEMGGAAARGAELTRQLLAFSRRTPEAATPVDLREVVTGAQMLLRRALGEDIRLDVRVADRLPLVRADAGQLGQVLLNLATNARDAMPAGGTLTIEVEVAAPSHVRLRVSDTGAGMSADVQARVFEPFYTTKGRKGTGLGLATTYAIVKQHGGEISVSSEPGRGATFTIVLPADLCASRIERLPRRAAIAPSCRGSESILLVEDEDDVRTMVSNALQDYGYAVTVARNAADALGAARGRDFDLVITDVIMPGGTGTTLASDLRRGQPHVKVLFTSGYPDHPEGDPGDCKDFLAKPFRPRELALAVRRLIDADPAPHDRPAVA